MLQDPAFIHADFGNILMNFTIWLGIIDVVIALFVPQQISQTGILKNGFFKIDCDVFLHSVSWNYFNDFVFRVQASLSFLHLVEWVWKAPWDDLQSRYSEYSAIIVLYYQR